MLAPSSDGFGEEEIAVVVGTGASANALGAKARASKETANTMLDRVSKEADVMQKTPWSRPRRRPTRQ
jgi:hypothetical protein